MLIRSAVAPFFARGDTATPVKAALIAVAVNIAFKILLMGPLAQVGLALATTIGAWINFALVVWFAWRAGFMRLDAGLVRSLAKLGAAGLALGVALWLAQRPALGLFAGRGARDLMGLAVLAALGAIVYGGVVLLLFGRQWIARLRRRRAAAAPSPRPADVLHE